MEKHSDHIFKSVFFSICVQNLLCLHSIDYIKDFSRPSSGKELLEERIDDNRLPTIGITHCYTGGLYDSDSIPAQKNFIGYSEWLFSDASVVTTENAVPVANRRKQHESTIV